MAAGIQGRGTALGAVCRAAEALHQSAHAGREREWKQREESGGKSAVTNRPPHRGSRVTRSSPGATSHAKKTTL
eukprot:365756-Chlamydomonas_euryale.AAC.3